MIDCAAAVSDIINASIMMQIFFILVSIFGFYITNMYANAQSAAIAIRNLIAKYLNTLT